MKSKKGKRTSEALWKRSLEVAPGGVHSPVRAFQSVGGTPLFFEKAEGAYLWSVSGERYIDFCMSFGPLLLGHLDPEVLSIVHETAKSAWSLGTCEPYSLELAEFICLELPWAEKIRFVSSGTEAVMSALRLARAAVNRESIVKFEGCYHGHLDSLLVKAGSGLANQSVPDSAGLGHTLVQNTFVLPLDDEDTLKAFFSEKGNQIAALIIEPLPANFGLLIQRKAFLEKAAHLAKKYGALLIFDEVISGFRVGLQGMAGLLGIQPDLLCLGKVIGGGFPVGAYAGKKEIMELVAPAGKVYQAGTLSANPFGMRAGLATLQKCKRENVYKTLAKNSCYFCGNLEKIWNAKSDQEWQVISFGSLFWLTTKTNQAIRSIRRIPKSHKKNYARLFHALLEYGIYFAPSGFEVAFLSMAHTKKILDDALEQIEKAIKN